MAMRTLLELFEAQKTIVGKPRWDIRDSMWFCLSCSLDIDGVTIEGLELKGGASQSLPDRAVRFHLQYAPSNKPCIGLARAEWRPTKTHTNRNFEPLPFARISASHIHRFEHNWMPELQKMRKGDLPVAVPIKPDPRSYLEFVEFVAKEFRIGGLESVGRPSWFEADLFGV